MRISKELLDKYNVQGPRYTSYPPANYFHEEYQGEQLKADIVNSNHEEPRNISLYFHIPFCPRICHFCGCNSQQCTDIAQIKRYHRALLKELEMVTSQIDKKRKLTQVHFGGGTPNALPAEYLAEIMEFVRNHFTFRDHAEVAIECNPAYLTYPYLQKLIDVGFNRVSIGIQDFDEDVLQNVNRLPSALPVDEMVSFLQSAKGVGVNMDLIYGLPGQTIESFLKSVKQVINIRPDRLVTFSYAHVPGFKSNQEAINVNALPSPDQKIQMIEQSYDLLTNSGYRAIGMDHYAKQTDELAVALDHKALHRNFQGYCTKDKTGQVYAMGATAISQLSNAYAQNYRDIFDYMQAVDVGHMPVFRGYRLNEDEKIIRESINILMCNKYFDMHQIADDTGVSVTELSRLLRINREELDKFEKDGLIVQHENGFDVTLKGHFFIRNIAMSIDPLMAHRNGNYSKTV